MVTSVWNQENKRVIQSYLRYTKDSERQQVLSLLEKTDEKHIIISIKSDMKTFNTHDLWEEIDKQEKLQPIFNIALGVLKQLKLPETTITYYGDLIFYYTGTRLSQLNPHMVGIYLLCYVYNRYQVLNDNLIEAFKKKTLMYQAKATDYAKNEAFKHLDLIRTTRERVSQVLVTIDTYPEPSVPKVEMYRSLPQDEFLTAAHLLVDESFDKDLLFWKYIDQEKDSIKLNLRSLFQAIQFVDVEHKDLNLAVEHLKALLASKVDTSLPSFIRGWMGKDAEKYLIAKEQLIPHRFEFFVYQKMFQQIKSNKLSLQHSIKHKKVEDELYAPKKWRREKGTILKKLDYPKLLAPIRKTLATKEKDLNNLYALVNRAVLDGTNTFVTVTTNKNGQKTWKLTPYEPVPDNDEGILSSMPQRGIVGIIQFVESQTRFSEVFDPILPKNSKLQRDIGLIMAVVLANAIRIGSKKMAGISDVSESALLTAEASYVRVETLCLAVDRLNDEVSKMPIFKEWYINGIPHGSLDGMKIETRLKNIKARGSSKYFPLGTGVSSYNEIMNGLSIAGKLIGSHEYEGNNTFEMAQHLNTSMIKERARNNFPFLIN
jgi:hypothetical protein